MRIVQSFHFKRYLNYAQMFRQIVCFDLDMLVNLPSTQHLHNMITYIIEEGYGYFYIKDIKLSHKNMQ